jgi:hypothetical protein
MSNFLRLPAELRNQIYDLLFADRWVPRRVIWHKQSWSRAILDHGRWTHSQQGSPLETLPILLVCRKLNLEVSSLLYSNSDFYARDATCALSFLQQIGPVNRSALRKLEFDVHGLGEIHKAFGSLRLLELSKPDLERLQITVLSANSGRGSRIMRATVPQTAKEKDKALNARDLFFEMLGIFEQAEVLHLEWRDELGSDVEMFENRRDRWTRVR